MELKVPKSFSPRPTQQTLKGHASTFALGCCWFREVLCISQSEGDVQGKKMSACPSCWMLPNGTELARAHRFFRSSLSFHTAES